VDIDYLVLMAQGYQESELNQNARSAAGAIGIMQVMPATGRDMRLGDITLLEPNIHAGIKFLRAMMNEHYASEPMDQLNRGLFTFAAYNAGPGRIAGLRRLAAQRGLNPNVWFNNVELMAAEKIGRETVTYVSNIYKYYLAYQMLAEERAERERARQAAREVK
jgi:membrane-bound lytic murein transglycosylase MltF